MQPTNPQESFILDEFHRLAMLAAGYTEPVSDNEHVAAVVCLAEAIPGSTVN